MVLLLLIYVVKKIQVSIDRGLITFLFPTLKMSEIELLEKIVKNTKPKTSFQIIVSSKSSSFSTRFIPSIELDRGKYTK